MKKLFSIVAATAALFVSLVAWCGLDRAGAMGSPKSPPVNLANVAQSTMGLSLVGSRAMLRAVCIVWAPIAAFYTAVEVACMASLMVLHRAIGAVFRPAQVPLGLGVTLTVQQLLLDVIGAFRKRFPAINMFGAQWTANSLKLNKKYTAHIASYGSASTYDATTGYANGANTARNGLVDVDVITDSQPTYPLKWLHLDGIKDDKNAYAKVMAGAGYVLGKGCIDTGFFAKMTSRYFSQELVTSVANFDYDVLQEITTALNAKGVEPEGRVLFVNSAAAAVLAVDARMISKDYAGQLLNGQGYRMWTNIGGFALIQEYPDLPSNNGTALTGVTAEADDDLFTKAAHGLETGDPVVVTAFTSIVGVTVGSRYWAIKASSSTFKLATTRALAIAGTGIDITTDGTSGTITPTENLVAFAADGRAFASLAGIPAGNDEMVRQLGITPTLMFDSITDPESRITMAAAKWQDPATGNVFWCPTFIYGTNAGKQGSTAVAGNTAAANSILAAANPDGTACDYAGLRISSGAT